jgi:hypothetical protein
MRWVWAAVLVIVAAVSAFSAFVIVVGNMMTPGGHRYDQLALIAIVTILALTVGGLLLAFKIQPATSGRWLAGATVLVVAVASVPHVVDWRWKAERAAQITAEQRAYQAEFLADLEVCKQDVEARIGARRIYTPEEADAFVAFVRRSNLAYVQGPDHMPAAMAMLQRALETKILDPNAPVQDWVMPSIGRVPLYLRLHRELRQAPERSVLTQDWNILLLLVANGADLSVPRAEPVTADLRKTAVPLYNGLYLDLK